jgi:uncharacterized small protein (DUF1192 family)
MDTDDLLPPPKAKPFNLEGLDVADLQARIAALEAEIARCRAIIAAKQDHRGAADALFRR